MKVKFLEVALNENNELSEYFISKKCLLRMPSMRKRLEKNSKKLF